MAYRVIFQFFKRYAFTYVLGIIFMVLSSYIQTLFPMVLGHAIDIMKTPGFRRPLVIRDICYILLIGAGVLLTKYIWRNCIIANARRLECYLRERFFSHLQGLSARFYNERKTGDLIAYGINDISAVRMTFGPATARAVNGLVICASSIYDMCVSIDWRLTLITMLSVPFVVLFTTRAGILVKRRFKKVQESFAAISDRVQENIYGIRVIKAYAQEKEEIRHFEALNDDITKANLDMVRISSALSPVIEMCFSVSFVINLILGGRMVLKGQITVGDFIAFNTYLLMIMDPIISIGSVINDIQKGMASLGRLNVIFNVKPDIPDPVNRSAKAPAGEIEIRHLSFAYPGAGRYALEDISLSIPKGHTLGIVGRTGAGKTTLVELLLKLYNVEDGRILFDGQDINTLPLDLLRGAVGIAPQNSFLFSASIRDNIRFWREGIPDAAAEEAAAQSCIGDFIKELPEGFDTMIGERGVNLSGGQKQRISIARAIASDPPILILDDTLSAVDTVTERRILENLRRLRAGKTTIIIAHRLSAVQKADEIIVLDRGRIAERGSHEALLAERGLYYELYLEQHRENDGAAVIQ